MSIIIFGDSFSFPEGNAATNRVHTYAKGFLENDIKVHVICFSNDYNKELDGVINDISYYHPFGQTKRKRHLLIRRWYKFIKYINCYNLCKEINEKDKILAINLWTNTLLTNLYAWILARLNRTKLIIERSEHPLRHHQNGAWNKMFGNMKLYFESHFCDGILCISNYLINFYKKAGIDPMKLLLVPSTVDPSRFLKIERNSLQDKYIGYFGSLTFKRDSVDQLIQAFEKIIALHPEYHLVLGGFCTEKEKKNIEELIVQLNIANKVNLLDYISRQEILTYISNADLLVMVRSNDLDSQASYPSKLTEYLATSKPVLTNNVGEISAYLTDGINAFLVEPGSSDLLAAKMDYILSNYEFAQSVGKNGEELTHTIFNYNFNAKKIIDFIMELK
jgi:glycosyltransferase involved in cell wall biosynthesis